MCCNANLRTSGPTRCSILIATTGSWLQAQNAARKTWNPGDLRTQACLGSDLGQKNNPLPVEGLRYTVEKLLDIGIKEHEIEFMIKKNEEALLGLEEAAERRLPAKKGA